MSISDIMYRSDGYSRIAAIAVDAKTLATPTYFPAISSFGIKHRFESLLELIIGYSYPRLLVSAYDIYPMKTTKKKEILGKISKYQKQSFVFMDSGMFESWWFRDNDWNFKRYKHVIEEANFDFYSSLDVFPSIESRSSGYIDSIIKSLESSREICNSPGFIAVFHGSTPTELVSVVEKTLEKIIDTTFIIAIPERDCGVNILDKTKTIAKIRRLLNKYDETSLLHILGCGHPQSVAMFSLCGADMFDSLDWINNALDPKTNGFNEISYLDFIDCDCRFCNDMDMIYIERVLLHNLLYYQNYMKDLRESIRENRLLSKVSDLIGSDTAQKILDSTDSEL